MYSDKRSSIDISSHIVDPDYYLHLLQDEMDGARKIKEKVKNGLSHLKKIEQDI